MGDQESANYVIGLGQEARGFRMLVCGYSSTSLDAMPFDFLSSARRVFDPLAQRFDMRFTVGSKWLLRYESDVTFLNVHFDYARSFELCVEIGWMATIASETSFSLGEVMRVSGSDSEQGLDGPQVRSQASLESALTNLANLTSRFASRALSGDEHVFVQLAELRDSECQALAQDRESRFFRSVAESAWANKNLARLIEAYGAIESYLTRAERKKLEYSRSHVGANRSS